MRRAVSVLVLLIVGLLFSAGGTVLAAEQGNCVLKIIAGNELAKKATVYLDGRVMGTLGREMSISNLLPAEYSLVFDGDTIERHEKTINFDFDYEMVQTTFIAKRATRVLDVRSDPSGARIFIDEEEVDCRTPCEVTVEVEKAYEIVLSLESHGWTTRMVNVPVKGDPIVLNIEIPAMEIPVPPMVLVEKDSFMMGDEFGDMGGAWYRPVHQVTFTYDFYIGKYEVTFDEYDAFCSATRRSKPRDSGWGRGTLPVINVSWNDAIAYCNWLSEKEKLPKAYDNNGNLLDKDGKVTTDPSKVVGYRLPTEAEWEYAARGGNKSKGYKYSGSDNVGDVAWYDSNSESKTQEVGKKAPNELGIYDMSGNVWEWCSDWYGGYSSSAQTNPYNNSGSFRVFRGGSWRRSAAYARVAFRLYYSPAFTYFDLGFRICRTVP
ncbi:formylglycine-generating enzyme family protein [Mesotoga sp.]|uniref:SUMF1/EgtB/PvdO family nonheme iron enzyme n=1 Tax=Mesotoga sp. TaxID=2053577 RepID=UPI001BD5CEAA|nr:formylglycine-generating enzyme family protein [Mesotoga sp.]